MPSGCDLPINSSLSSSKLSLFLQLSQRFGAQRKLCQSGEETFMRFDSPPTEYGFIRLPKFSCMLSLGKFLLSIYNYLNYNNSLKSILYKLEMSFTQTFASFDIFKKMPKDLTEPTFCGALGTHKFFIYLLTFSYSFNYLYFTTSYSLLHRNQCLHES